MCAFCASLLELTERMRENACQEMRAKKRRKMEPISVRCSHNHLHVSFNLDKKRCRTEDRSAGLEKLCSQCKTYCSYSNAASHAKKCKQKQHIEVAEVEQKVRVVYISAAWTDGVAQGLYREDLPQGFPAHFHTVESNDPLMGQWKSVAAYDAIWGSIFASNKRFELVQTSETVEELLSAAESATLPKALNIIVVHDWIISSALTEGNDAVEGSLKTFQRLEMEHSLRIFPPLEYGWYFAHKASYLSRLQQCRLPLGASVIPTLVVPTGHMWRKTVQEFVRVHSKDPKHVMFKRELSEKYNHVMKMDLKNIVALEGRAEGNAYRWVAQPFLSEFDASSEFRMYVINGHCSWGLATRFVEDGKMSIAPVAPGRRSWELDGGREAASLAEQVVALVSREQTHAARFLRVDMVRQHDKSKGWWINELEFFGNAHINFEAFDSASELLAPLVEMTVQWVRDMF